MPQQIGAHRCVPMKVDIGIERTRHLGARWLLDQGIPFAAPAARKPLRFLGGDKAFVEAHLAVLTDLDVHTAALALARMGMIPRPEPLAALHHDDIGPTRSEEHTSELQSLMRYPYA